MVPALTPVFWQSDELVLRLVIQPKASRDSLVGLHGALYASGVEDNSRLEVRWGSHTNEHCFIQMPDNHHQPVKKIGYTQITAQCVGS